ncbi:MAG: hypothetical protein NPIRA04_13380 [Nitrospirales bacterium]|nr:MAG: hypothetical protein NPIRA04_13380 [Nitrospirales bacterium]
MRYALTILSLVLLLLFGFPILGFTEKTESPSEHNPETSTSLTSLVQAYLTASDSESAQTLLSDILAHPDASNAVRCSLK